MIMVDMQRYFLQKDSSYSLVLDSRVAGYTAYMLEEVNSATIPNLQRLIHHFRNIKGTIIWTALASQSPDGDDLAKPLRNLNLIAFESGLAAAIPWREDPWAQFLHELEPAENESVVYKTTYGAFATSDLANMLTDRGINTLVMGGVISNVCVEATAREAVDRGFDVIIAKDACAAYSPEVHEGNLLAFQAVYGPVLATQEILALLDIA